MVIDDVVVGPDRLAVYEGHLAPRPLSVVVLAPPVEVALARDHERGYKRMGDRWAHLDVEQPEGLAGTGVWLDTAELTPQKTVDAILAARPAA